MSGEPAFAIPSDVLFRQVGSEMVLLHLESEQYFGLNPVGAEFVRLATTEPWDDALATLQAQYEVDPDVLVQDMDELVDALLKAGLLDRADHPGP